MRARIRANSSVSLGRYFRGLARSAVAAGALVTASACSSPWPESNPDFRAPLCADNGWQAAHGIEPEGGFDYLAVYIFGPFDGVPTKIDEVGVACETATDITACTTALEASNMASSSHVVITRGDEVTRFETEDALRVFLGEINTPEEAVLLVAFRGNNIVCGDIERAAVREVQGGWEVVASRVTEACDPVEVTRFLFHVSRDGTITQLDDDVVSSESGVCIGRRPQGLRPSARATGLDPVASYFAAGARLEAAAVPAFDDLAAELAHHGAPAALVDEARRAACDEVRHAELVGALATRFGADVRAPEIDARPMRSLLAMALDNAAEGCVRETFGALVGTHQAVAAGDREVGRVMAGVAADETRHASLAWRIAAWLDERLDVRERAEVREAMREAVGMLRREMEVDPDPALAEVAGLPSAEAALALLDQLDAELWTPACA